MTCMWKMKLGYARCSTLDQNLDWQIDALTKEGRDRIIGCLRIYGKESIVVPVLQEGNVITLIIIDLEHLERIADLIGRKWQ